MKPWQMTACCPMRKTSCHRRREEKFPPQRRRGAENAENAEEYANSHCLCDLCVLCASAVKVLVLLLTAWGSKPTFAKVSLQADSAVASAGWGSPPDCACGASGSVN